MATVEGDIHAALMTHVAALSLTPAIPLLYREIPAEKPETYIEVDHLPNTNTRICLDGDGRMQRAGILQLTLCSKIGEYEAVYREKAGQIAAHFARDARLSSGWVTVAISRADVGRGFADGAHWRTPVSIYYETFA